MGTLFKYHQCCECTEQATMMRSSGEGSSTVVVWYCAKHSLIKPLQSGIDRIAQLEADLAAAQAASAAIIIQRDEALIAESRAVADAAALRKAWALAKRMNECHLILTGDEIRHCDAAIEARGAA